MTFVTAQLVMQVAILSTAAAHTDTYRQAYEQAQERHQPLLVLVGTESCTACETMKTESMPEMKGDGSLDEVAFAMVDRDKHPKLANLLMQGDAVPQLVLYTRVGDQWRRSQLTGASAPSDVRQFIEREVSHAKTL